MQNKAVKIRDPIAPPPIFQSPQQYKEDRWLYDMGLVDDETWKRFYPNEPFQRFCPKTEKAKKYAEMKEYAERVSQRDFDRMDYYKWDELDSNVMLNGGKNSKDVEEALYKIINIALKQGKLKDRKASQIYSRYLNKLQSMSNTEFRETLDKITKYFLIIRDELVIVAQQSFSIIKGSTNQIYQHAKWKQREKALRAKHVNYETECAKYARLKKKDKNLRANHAKLKQRFRLLEQQVNQPLANMATLEHVMLALAPLVAQIPLYTGQEPPDAYIDKMEQLFTYGTALNVAGFNAAVKTDILKSKIHDNVQTQIMPVIQPAMPITQPVTNPTQNIINSNQQVIDQLKSLIMQNKAVKIRDPIAPPPIFQSPQQYKEDRWLYDMGLVDDETWKRFYPNEPFQRFWV
ncbi:11928_t:CDS:2 [Entrophospora sp. SA101]|nr:11928_t:CDS:2 [Entrophospora sp. SA101]